jgi:TrmH family RNA methyltransferase
MGSAFRLSIWARAEIVDVVDWARANRFSLAGAVLDGEKIYSDIDWKQPRLLVMGSEAHGIPPNVANVLDEKIKIPMASEVESLNLAVAAAVIMFEARRQVNTELKR